MTQKDDEALLLVFASWLQRFDGAAKLQPSYYESDAETLVSMAREHFTLTAAKPQIRGDEEVEREAMRLFGKAPSHWFKLSHYKREKYREPARNNLHPLSDTGLSDEMRGKLKEQLSTVFCQVIGMDVSLSGGYLADAALALIESNYTLIPKGNR